MHEGKPRPRMILHVIHHLGVGGAETALLSLCRHLDRQRFTPVICCLDHRGTLASSFEKHGIEVEALNRQPGIRSDTLWRLARLMRSRRPDVVHTHGWPASFWGRLAAVLAGRFRMIDTEHGEHSERSPIHAVIDTLLGLWTARVVAVSNHLGTQCRHGRRAWPNRIEVIPNGVDVDALQRRFDPVRARETLGVPASVPTVGIVGRLHPVKGHDVFLDAVHLLRDRLPGLLALVIGDGAERAAIERRIAALGIADSIRLIGERSDVHDLLGAIDVMMITSRNEGCPLVALEAMAAGVAMVVPSIAAFEEISDGGTTAVLVPPGDAASFADAALGILCDERRRTVLRAAARQRARHHYSVFQQVTRTERLYDRVIRSDRRDSCELTTGGQR